MNYKYPCLKCHHYLKNRKCKAYPKGIPEEILEGKKKHEKVLADQIGEYIFKENEILKNLRENRAKAEKKLDEDLIRNYESNKVKFAAILLNHLKETGLYLSDWKKVILEMEQTIGPSYAMCTQYDFHLENELGITKLKREIDRTSEKWYYNNEGRRFKELRRKLWRTEYALNGKKYKKIKFCLYKDNELLEIYSLQSNGEIVSEKN